MKRMIQLFIVALALTSISCAHYNRGGGPGASCACGGSAQDAQKAECDLKGDCKDGCKCGGK